MQPRGINGGFGSISPSPSTSLCSEGQPNSIIFNVQKIFSYLANNLPTHQILEEAQREGEGCTGTQGTSPRPCAGLLLDGSPPACSCVSLSGADG